MTRSVDARPGVASAHDHDGTGSVLGYPLGGRAEQVVAEEVATVAEHHEVVVAGRSEIRDHRRRVTGSQGDVQLDTGVRRPVSCPCGEVAEEEVFLTLDLVDLARSLPDRLVAAPRSRGPSTPPA